MRRAAPAIAALALVLTLAACAQAPGAAPTPAPSASAAVQAAPTPPAARLVGQPLPTLAFRDLQDQPRTSAEFAGKPAVYVVFAYWCGHCQREVPRLQAFAKTQGLALVPIEGSNGPKAEVEGFVKTYAIDVPTFFDPAAAAAATLEVTAFPTVLAVDAGGVVRDVTVGNVDTDRYAQLLGK